jgi:hypothetical protein
MNKMDKMRKKKNTHPTKLTHCKKKKYICKHKECNNIYKQQYSKQSRQTHAHIYTHKHNHVHVRMYRNISFYAGVHKGRNNTKNIPNVDNENVTVSVIRSLNN